MKRISGEEFSRIIEDNIAQYPEAANTNLWAAWMKAGRHINAAMSILIVVMLVLSTRHSSFVPFRDFLRERIMIFESNIINTVLIMAVTLLFVFLYKVIEVIIHEFLHIIAFPKRFKDCYIIIKLPKVISVGADYWIPKYRSMLILILPCLVFIGAAFAVFFVTGSVFFTVWILMNALGSSISDIFAFFYFGFKVPKGALILGHYYRFPN